MNKHSADKKLVKRLLAQDERAFKEFFDTYFDRLYRFSLHRLGGNTEATRDVAQSTLIRAIRGLATYRGEAGLFTWLCTLCRHEVSDYYRREARHLDHVELVEDRPDVRAALESLDATESGDPESGFRRLERFRIIQVALDQLPPRYADALEWKYVYGHSTREIAARLEIGTEAAQSLLARAKRAFRDVYFTLQQELVGNSPVSRPLSGR